MPKIDSNLDSFPPHIRKHFAPGALKESVPTVLNDLLIGRTETLASLEPEFRYSEIRLKFGGVILVYVEDEGKYSSDFIEAVEDVSRSLTVAYCEHFSPKR